MGKKEKVEIRKTRIKVSKKGVKTVVLIPLDEGKDSKKK